MDQGKNDGKRQKRVDSQLSVPPAPKQNNDWVSKLTFEVPYVIPNSIIV